jgi:hypothetical protein
LPKKYQAMKAPAPGKGRDFMAFFMAGNRSNEQKLK